jgi:hypothetical protein
LRTLNNSLGLARGGQSSEVLRSPQDDTPELFVRPLGGPAHEELVAVVDELVKQKFGDGKIG